MDKNENSDYEFLKEYSSWNAGKKESEQISLFDFATFIATPDILFAMDSLFNPTIIEHDGCYFIKHKFCVDSYDGWVKKGISPREIEKVMNHVHLTSILQSVDVEFSQAIHCAKLLCEIWNRNLKCSSLVAIFFGESVQDLCITIYSDNSQ